MKALCSPCRLVVKSYSLSVLYLWPLVLGPAIRKFIGSRSQKVEKFPRVVFRDNTETLRPDTLESLLP